MFWWLFPNMGEKVFKWLHVLSSVSDELILRETGNVDLDFPLVLTLM